MHNARMLMPNVCGICLTPASVIHECQANAFAERFLANTGHGYADTEGLTTHHTTCYLQSPLLRRSPGDKV